MVRGKVGRENRLTTLRHLCASPVIESASSIPSHASRSTANSSPGGRARAKSPKAVFNVS